MEFQLEAEEFLNSLKRKINREIICYPKVINSLNK